MEEFAQFSTKQKILMGITSVVSLPVLYVAYCIAWLATH